MKKPVQKSPLSAMRLAFLFLCLVAIVGINSCKKEIKVISHSETLSNTPATKTSGPPNAQRISFKAFLDSTKKISSGALNTLMLKSLVRPGQLKLNGTNSKDSLLLFIDSIKLVQRFGHQTYTFPIKQAHVYDISFRNLIIDVYNGNITTFLMTYTPDKSYITNYVNHKPAMFSGKAKLEVYDINNNGAGLAIQSAGALKTMLAQECISFDVFTGVSYYACPCDGHSWADPSCTCPIRGYFELNFVTASVCFDVEIGGGGGTPTGGGGGGTPPTTPPDYDPCNPTGTNAAGIKTQQVAQPCDVPSGPTIGDLINQFCVTYNLSGTQNAWLNQNLSIFYALSNYVSNSNIPEQDKTDFLNYSVTRAINDPSLSAQELLNQVLQPEITAELATNESDNEVYTDPDPTIPVEYQQTTPWPTISRVIPYDDFVPHRKNPDGTDVNCLTLAREQLAKVGYTASGWLPNSQTFQTYSATTGVNISRTKQAITYVITSLTNNIPVIVGVDAYSGSSNSDGITDHFMVIDGMGTETDGRKYFHFIDNSTNIITKGNSSENKLYYDSTTGAIIGRSQSGYPGNVPNSHAYIVTQIRKSIKK